MTAIAIPSALLAELYAHACAAFPDECCGYFIGSANGSEVDAIVRCHNAQSTAGDPVHSARGSDTGYAIGGRELFELAASFRTERPARIVYHSHPNGRAYFSKLDRAIATGPEGPVYPVQHLVVGIASGLVTEAAQFGWVADANDYVELARWPR